MRLSLLQKKTSQFLISIGYDSISSNQIVLFRIMVFSVFGIESWLHLNPNFQNYYNISTFQYPVIELLHIPRYFSFILLVRMFSASSVVTGFFPNIFKYIYLLALLLDLNQNTIVESDHIFPELVIAILAVVPYYPANRWLFVQATHKRKEKTKKYLGKKLLVNFHRGQISNEIIFWNALKLFLFVAYINYFFSAWAMLGADEVNIWRIIELVVLFVLMLLMLLHKKFPLALILLAFGYHLTDFLWDEGSVAFLMMSLIFCTFLPSLPSKNNWKKLLLFLVNH